LTCRALDSFSSSAAISPSDEKKAEAWKTACAKRAADRASELQANIAQPKRMSAGQSPASSARFVGWRLLARI